jgi:hypothetical protein
MCGNFLKKIDHIHSKKIAFEVKKSDFLHPPKHDLKTLNPLGLKLLYYTKFNFLIFCQEIELEIY